MTMAVKTTTGVEKMIQALEARHGAWKSSNCLQFYHGKTQFYHRKTQFYHGKTQFYHRKTQFYHGKTQFYHGNTQYIWLYSLDLTHL